MVVLAHRIYTYSASIEYRTQFWYRQVSSGIVRYRQVSSGIEDIVPALILFGFYARDILLLIISTRIQVTNQYLNKWAFVSFPGMPVKIFNLLRGFYLPGQLSYPSPVASVVPSLRTTSSALHRGCCFGCQQSRSLLGTMLKTSWILSSRYAWLAIQLFKTVQDRSRLYETAAVASAESHDYL